MNSQPQADGDCPPSILPTTAEAPFNKTTNLILRSSDHVDFHVWTCILKEASSMFDAMLSIPQPPTDPSHPDVPVIPVTEDSAALRRVLELCYPMAPSIVQEKNLDVVLHTIEVAMKYSMEWPVTLVEQSLKELAEDQPLRVYAVAQRHRLADLARHAAKVTLRYPFPGDYCPELEDITGGAYFKLVKYHEHCANVIGEIMQNLSWMGRRTQYIWFTCNNVKCFPSGGRYICEGFAPKSWWTGYMDKVQADLRKKPCKETVLSSDIETVALGISCPNCKARAHIDLSKFRVLLAKEIEKRTSVVDLKLK